MFFSKNTNKMFCLLPKGKYSSPQREKSSGLWQQLIDNRSKVFWPITWEIHMSLVFEHCQFTNHMGIPLDKTACLGKVPTQQKMTSVNIIITSFRDVIWEIYKLLVSKRQQFANHLGIPSDKTAYLEKAPTQQGMTSVNLPETSFGDVTWEIHKPLVSEL
jgi:hypothetical protein